MSKVRYHINPETGRAGICRAKRSCRFNMTAAEHYPSLHEARQEAEGVLAEGRDIIAQPLKKKKPIQKRKKNEFDDDDLDIDDLDPKEAELYALEKSDDSNDDVILSSGDALIKSHFNQSIESNVAGFFANDTYPMGAHAIAVYPGCEGCDGSGNQSYCDCEEFTGDVAINKKEVVNYFYNRLQREENPDFDQHTKYGKQTDDAKDVQKKLQQILQRHGLLNDSNYIVHSRPATGGEEIIGTTCLADVSGAEKEFQRIFK